MDITRLCRGMDALHASDLFISVGKPVAARVLGAIQELEATPVTSADMESFLQAHLPEGARQRFEQERDLDIGVSMGERERYRFNLYFQRGHACMAIRRVPVGELGFSDLHVPEAVRRLAEQPRGLVLITGSTGSGKSTTMAAMLNHQQTVFTV